MSPPTHPPPPTRTLHTNPPAVVITGPSAGTIGGATATALAAANPKELLLLGRTESKIAPVLAAIKTINPAVSARFVELDLGSLASVRDAARVVNESVARVDVLINNAGIMAVREYAKTEDGVESQFATNYLGHFLLTKLLVEKIAAAGEGARVVNLASLAYELEEFRFGDWNFEVCVRGQGGVFLPHPDLGWVVGWNAADVRIKDGKTYNPWSAYGQSKTAIILFTHGLARRLGGRGIYSFSVQPGCRSYRLPVCR